MTPQRVVGGVALVVLLLAVGYSLLPFKVAGAVSCKAPLMGGGPEKTPTTIGFIQPKKDCPTQGRRRLTGAAFFALVAVAGVAGVLLVPPESQECRDGDHDACRGRWPISFGMRPDTGTCRCACHG